MTCSVPGCERPVRVESCKLCSQHYWRKQTHGTVQADVPIAPRHTQRFRCRWRGCTRTPIARDLCRPHYQWWRRLRPDGPKCTVDGCDENVSAKGKCHTHYEQDWRRARRGKEAT